jgi:uncharacterized protein YhfF
MRKTNYVRLKEKFMNEQWWQSLNKFSFGDTPQMADELATLVIQGVKRGSSWLHSEGQQHKWDKNM